MALLLYAHTCSIHARLGCVCVLHIFLHLTYSSELGNLTPHGGIVVSSATGSKAVRAELPLLFLGVRACFCVA